MTAQKVRRNDLTVVDKGAGNIRVFSSGANRDTAEGKYDYDGFLSPLVLEAFGAYMNFNRQLPDGSLRDSDNWQLGIPQQVYRKSFWRHAFDFWKAARGYPIKENILFAAMGIFFNVQGWMHEEIKKDPTLIERCIAEMEAKRAARLAEAARGRK